MASTPAPGTGEPPAEGADDAAAEEAAKKTELYGGVMPPEVEESPIAPCIQKLKSAMTVELIIFIIGVALAFISFGILFLFHILSSNGTILFVKLPPTPRKVPMKVVEEVTQAALKAVSHK
ncbi:unnamed protein product [Caenorhabditis bovis]|uniref:Uncharacterized protein n=1 Tax=Caenorhabditis bovis TaxID=2654633 RepID=A0A8S1F1U7_9PELO|nr:unnamed protein product [Caenorhabditis bovis]